MYWETIEQKLNELLLLATLLMDLPNILLGSREQRKGYPMYIFIYIKIDNR